MVGGARACCNPPRQAKQQAPSEPCCYIAFASPRPETAAAKPRPPRRCCPRTHITTAHTHLSDNSFTVFTR
ncbi:hypothetical protein E2C01_062382 [Portunus trituberculatus]|uniref:Uncharacterized protein n=1 Tax=Portunus trituberculatus TaxID=210409 RepID=A0A5B7HEZ0_PORTR|nr:hypothetical protein [Portunus trituberculatus]